jgi:type II secretory pathway pseudopilin PulG
LVVIAVILLLVGLVAIPLASRGRQSAAEHETTMVLKTLSGALTELYILRRSQVAHYSTPQLDWSDAQAYNAPTSPVTPQSFDEAWEWPATAPARVIDQPSDSIERFLWVAMQTPASAQLIRPLSDRFLRDRDGDGYLEVRDAWGHKLRYAAYHSYETWVDGSNGGSLDGVPEQIEMRPLFETDPNWYQGWPGDVYWVDSLPQRGSETNRKPLFLSAGSDGRFGRYGYQQYTGADRATAEQVAQSRDNLTSQSAK